VVLGLATDLLNSLPDMNHTHAKTAGFSLVEMMIVTAIVAIIAGMGLPLLVNISNSIKLSSSAREVERELQTARFRAVSTNQPMRLQFNCPLPGQYRIVELVGTSSVPAAADNAANRCAMASYPFPSDTDRNPLTRPNFDGPVRYIDSSVSFSVVTTIEFWPDGTAHTNTGGSNPWPVIGANSTSVVLTRNGQTKTILVNGLGKIQTQ
jgi:prepilin-type N-terminal cleavage/methylation domain-containing protein